MTGKARTIARHGTWLALLAAILTGLPVLLWMLGEPPLHLPPEVPLITHLRSYLAWLLNDATAVAALARIAAWAGWAWFTAAFAIESVALLRGRRARRIVGMGWMQSLVAKALTATTVGVTGAVPVIRAAMPAVAYAATAPASPHAPTSASAPGHRPTTAAGDDARLYRVRRGDTLWSIAARQLGDPLRYREIAALNAGRVMEDGRVFKDADWIYLGWVLRLPPEPGTRMPPPVLPAGNVHPGRHEDGASGGGACPIAVPVPRDVAGAHPIRPGHVSQSPTGVRLPSGAAIGISFAAGVGSAIVLARARRSWRRGIPGFSMMPPPAEPGLPPPLAVMRQAHLDTQAPPAAGDTGDDRPTCSGTPLPLLEPPAQLICAHAPDGAEMRVDLARSGGFTLSGDGAVGAARAIICGLLLVARRTPVEVVMPEQDASVCLGTGMEVPGLTVVPDLNAAMTHVETARLARARQLEEETRAVPGMPLLVLAAAVPEPDTRLTALLTDVAAYGIGAVLLVGRQGEPSCEIAADGTVRDASGVLDGSAMFTLARQDAQDVLNLLAQGVRHQDDEDGSDEEPSRQLPDEEPRSALARPVLITVLGQPAIHARGTEIATGLRTDTRQLLALLAVYKDGLTLESAAGKLWPDAKPGTLSSRFHTAIGNARTVLRAATGARSAMFIQHIGSRYRLDPAVVDCDLWHFGTAIAQARTAKALADRIAALRRAADFYTGPLIDGCYLEWAEPLRETAVGQAAGALTQLADLLWDDDPDDAVAYLERAVIIDEYNEELHRHLMTRQGTLGRLDAVRRTYQHLERRLAAIDAEPAQVTDDLFKRLAIEAVS